MNDNKKFIFKRIKRKLAKIISPQTQIETYFNVPFRFYDAQSYSVNERIIEVPFVFSALEADEKKLKILDFGCTNSWLPISLASLGHEVHGVDLREYPFLHPNLAFKKQDIMQLEETGFDVVIAVSSLEHVGLNAYGATYEPTVMDKIIAKIKELLVDKGKFILTLPVGDSFTDDFLRSFTPEEIEHLITTHGFSLEKSRFFHRVNYQQWFPCTREKIRDVSNRLDKNITSRCGVNGIGCFVFRK